MTNSSLVFDKQGRVKLKCKGETLLDFVNLLKEYDHPLIRKVNKDQLKDLSKPGAYQSEEPYIIMPLYESRNKPLKRVYLVFSNHGQVHFCKDEYLTDYLFDKPFFYWNFKLPIYASSDRLYADSYIFSDDDDAIDNWEATYYIDAIFDYYGFNGLDDMAPLVGFFYVE